MTLQELENWFEESEIVDSREEWDEYSNNRLCNIYLHKGNHYAVYFCNGHPSEQWGEKGYIRDSYEPVPVKRKTETIVIEKWLCPDGHEVDWHM